MPLIPLNDPRRQMAKCLTDMEQQLGAVLSRHLLDDPEWISELERKIATMNGFHHGLSTASATDAFVLALRSLGLRPGSEVLTSAYGPSHVANAIRWAGLKPRFADVCPDTGFPSESDWQKSYDPDVRVLFTYDLFGRQSSEAWLREFVDKRSLTWIVDGTLSLGLPRPTLPDLLCLGFSSTATGLAIGNAGMILCSDSARSGRLWELAHQGFTFRQRQVRIGIESRMDGLQASVLSAKLPHLVSWVVQRRSLASWYRQALRPYGESGQLILMDPPSTPEGSAWTYFPIRVPKARDEFIQALKNCDVQVIAPHPTPIPRQPAFGERGEYPGAAQLAEQGVCLPIFAEMTVRELETVLDSVARWARPSA